MSIPLEPRQTLPSSIEIIMNSDTSSSSGISGSLGSISSSTDNSTDNSTNSAEELGTEFLGMSFRGTECGTAALRDVELGVDAAGAAGEDVCAICLDTERSEKSVFLCSNCEGCLLHQKCFDHYKQSLQSSNPPGVRCVRCHGGNLSSPQPQLLRTLSYIAPLQGEHRQTTPAPFMWVVRVAHRLPPNAGKFLLVTFITFMVLLALAICALAGITYVMSIILIDNNTLYRIKVECGATEHTAFASYFVIETLHFLASWVYRKKRTLRDAWGRPIPTQPPGRTQECIRPLICIAYFIVCLISFWSTSSRHNAECQRLMGDTASLYSPGTVYVLQRIVCITNIFLYCANCMTCVRVDAPPAARE